MASLGTYMRTERELRDLSLAEIAQTTRIPVRVLINLESDAEEQFPAEVFVRGYLRAYAKAVGIPAAELLGRFRRDESGSRPPAPLPSLPPPDSGHRFGMAIALVILLILFTLALSIVLRPRRRDTPVQLSERTPIHLRWVESEKGGADERGGSEHSGSVALLLDVVV